MQQNIGMILPFPMHAEHLTVHALPMHHAGLTMQQNIGVLVALWGGVEALKLAAFHVAHRAGLI